MNKFEKHLKKENIDIEEVEQFLKGLDIYWDKSTLEGEPFFDRYPALLKFKGIDKVFEDFLCVDRFEFTLYRELENPSKKNINLSNRWIAFRLKRKPELLNEYKNYLENELKEAKKIKETAQKEINEEYNKKRELLEESYKYEMRNTEYLSEKIHDLLNTVKSCEREM